VATLEPAPLYYRVELQIRELIEKGVYKRGEYLPSETELSRTFSVSRITVRRALARLQNAGWITRHQGKPTYINTEFHREAKLERSLKNILGFSESLASHGRVPDVQVLSDDEVSFEAQVAEFLRIPDQPRGREIRRLGKVDGEPLWVEVRYFPDAVAQRLTNEAISSPSLVKELDSIEGLAVWETSVTIEASPASKHEAALLGLHLGDPLLDYSMVASTSTHQPIFYMKSSFRWDRYRLSFSTAR